MPHLCDEIGTPPLNLPATLSLFRPVQHYLRRRRGRCQGSFLTAEPPSLDYVQRKDPTL